MGSIGGLGPDSIAEQNNYADEWVAKWSRALASSFGIDKWGV
jgi:hypothetical protein